MPARIRSRMFDVMSQKLIVPGPGKNRTFCDRKELSVTENSVA